MRTRVGSLPGRLDGGTDLLRALRDGWVAAGELRRRLAWRRRRLVLRYRGVVYGVCLAVFVAGVAWAPGLQERVAASVLLGRDRVWGQVVLRPPVGAGVVRGVSVRLLPSGPVYGLSGVLLALAADSPESVDARLDHAGRWSTPAVAPRWFYLVLVETEGCVPRLAGPVAPGWLRSVRVDVGMRPCVVPAEPRPGS